jgi:hypothetical protein
MVTVAEFKNGAVLPAPIYRHKPYVILNADEVVLKAGTLDEVSERGYLDYLDKCGSCSVDIRRHDLAYNDNAKI